MGKDSEPKFNQQNENPFGLSLDQVRAVIRSNMLVLFFYTFVMAVLSSCVRDQGKPDYCNKSSPEISDVKKSELPWPMNRACYNDEEFAARYVPKVDDPKEEWNVAMYVTIVVHEEVSVDEIKKGIKEEIRLLNELVAESEPEVKFEFYVTGVEEIYSDDVERYFHDSTFKDSFDLDTEFIPELDGETMHILWLPKTGRADGTTYSPPKELVTVYYSHPDYDIDQWFPGVGLQSPPDGYSQNYVLTHEVLHYFGLVDVSGSASGDMIPGTVDYFTTCSLDPENFPNNTWGIEYTVGEDGVCMVSCEGGCFELPANVMHVNIGCEPGTKQVITRRQKEIVDCNIRATTTYDEIIHSDYERRPEVELVVGE